MLITLYMFVLLTFTNTISVDSSKVLMRHGLTETNKPTEWFYYPPVELRVSNIFSSARIQIDSKQPFTIVTTNSTEQTTSPYRLWKKLFQHTTTNSTTISLPPFLPFAFKLDTYSGWKHNDYVKIHTDFYKVDIHNVGLCLAGILLFKNAKFLSRSRLFHYTTGASAGVLLSWCVVLVLLYKFMPLKRYVTGLMVAISGAGIFFTQKLLENAKHLITEYPQYAISLSAISALLSLSLLYYYGPPSSERALNLVQWFLQLSALFVVYQSSYSKQVSITMVTLLVFSEFCSVTSFLAKLLTMIIPRKYMRMLHAPPKRRYLTQEEYEHQGVVETEQALRELKEFCNSPKCNSWDVVSRIKQPKRFADFLHTSRHVPDDEIHMHEETDDFYQMHENSNKSILDQSHDTPSRGETSSQISFPMSSQRNLAPIPSQSEPIDHMTLEQPIGSNPIDHMTLEQPIESDDDDSIAGADVTWMSNDLSE